MHQAVFRLLGPLEVQVGGESLRIGGARQRTVLTMLLLSPCRVVSVDALIEAVWPTGGPNTARNQIAICVAGLRKVFKDTVGVNELILTSHPGYILNPLEHRIDAVDFQDRVGQARELARGGQATEACEVFSEALALWRGRAMDGVTGLHIEQEAVRLEELRLDVHEEYAGLQLQLGRHHTLIPALTALVAEHPLREQARAHLILANYRAGRRADALHVFREGRRLLVDELGIEPGPALQGLHDLVLQDSPELSQPATQLAQPRAANVPAQLPVDSASFTGRAKELSAMDRMLDERLGLSPLTIAAITGIGGVGKTALAVRWANNVAARFPDGQLFTDLRGYDEKDDPVPPATILDRFLRALGVPAQQIPADPGDRAALYRSVLGGKRVLIVLDNARSFQQIRPLLPGNGRCCVLITGRDIMGEMIGDYAVLQIGLQSMDPEEAAALLGEVAGDDRIGADPVGTARLGELCDRLPLALRIAGARLAAKPHWSVRSLVGRLENQRRRLDELSPGEGGVRAGFRLSYRDLSAAARQLYRRLGLLNVPDFAAWVGAALIGADRMDAENLLEQLVDAQLLEVATASGPVTRYRFQDLLRLFAWETAQAEETEEERGAALERAYGGWLALADAARLLTYGGERAISYGRVERMTLEPELVEELLADPMEWFESERSALIDVIEQAAGSERSAYAWALTQNSTPLFEVRHYWEDWRSCAEHSLRAAEQAGDRLGEAAMLRSLGTLAIYRRDYREARGWLTRAAPLWDELGEVHGKALALRSLALCARFFGDLEGAARDARESLECFREAGDGAGESHVMGLLAQVEMERGNLTAGIALCTEAIAKSRQAGSGRGENQNTYRLAEALLRLGDLTQAEQTCTTVLRLTREGGDRLGEAYALRGIGEARWRQDRSADAEAVLAEALVAAREVQDRFLQARISLDLACALALRGEARAREPLGLAREAFTELGAAEWQRRAEEIARTLDLSQAPAPTPRELAAVLEG
ncbi:AfsR/SARP family transcriptional regulator [Streptomyces sp. NPDC091268]|uniref:AfsR/SARP family transcriptional regulator n=1 Tax=Streptomyces sp. NPDC091268 TaxID=3365979 RepID=UPI00380D435A